MKSKGDKGRGCCESNTWKEVHDVRYFDGLFVDTECGERIWGKEGKEYKLFFLILLSK